MVADDHPQAIVAPRDGLVRRPNGQNSLAPAALSTNEYAADPSAARAQNSGESTAGSNIYLGHTSSEDQSRAAIRTLPEDGGTGRPPDRVDSVKPLLRVPRNALQAIQDHLTSSSRDTWLRKPREGATGPVLASSSHSRAPTIQASFPRDEALRPGGPLPSDETVPSLLLRLSDPVRTASEQSPNAENNTAGGSPSSGRETLIARKGNGISASEMMTPTRGHATQTAEGMDSSVAPPPTRSHQPHRAAGLHHDLEYKGGVNDVKDAEEVGLMSSKSRSGRPRRLYATLPATPKAHQVLLPPLGTSMATRTGGEARSAPPSTDPRFLLMRKLELEKRRALDVPTAEKSQLSSSDIARHDAPFVPTAFSVEHTKSGVPGAKFVAAERQAERREAELRSQAQLRVRLAAAKRVALQDAATTMGGSAHIGIGGPSPIDDDEDLQSQELELKNKLRARKT